MASFADLRPIIVITVFLSLFIFFISMLATTPEIWSSDTLSQRINAEESFVGSNMLYWNMTNGTLIDPAHGWTSDGNFGDVEIKLYTYTSSLLYPVFQVDSYITTIWGPISYQDWNSFEHFEWYTKDNRTTVISHDLYDDPNYPPGSAPGHGIRIHDLDLLYYETDNLESLQLYIKNSRTSSEVAFIFDQASYGTPGAAWANGDLVVTFGNNYSQDQSGMNAFDLIMGLLFWSLPGVPTEIYLIVSFIVWPPIVYVAAIWVLRLIGSVFGGGASG